MRPHRLVAAVLGLVSLTACFYSEVPLIPPSAQVTLPHASVILCLEDDCRTVQADADGVYEISPPEGEDDEKPMNVRFQRLVADGPNPVYLAEAENLDEPDVTYNYLVAHVRMTAGGDIPTYEFAMPDCAEASDETLEQYALVRVDKYACRVTDLDAFKAYLVAQHGDDFETAEFWQDN
ncbi:hypothetical protein [Hyphomonas johnsonii]|uniref:Lipoprotein n=1 Tax=Hyphomonas johnsonii MHS-2 TaxID=1280950 RepID=A0A059FS69_9PROT|nr:hypothetical protein [Hyphomonas johnsonii]KCZ93313.1 hypothetical protein HJO_05640 [Hyphomonas johnsonii MHS-2]